MNKKIIGNFLRSLREEKKLTQAGLVEEFGDIYSDATISKWERGSSVPNIDDLKTLAKYFNVTVDEILNGARYEETDFKKKYFIYNNEWLSSHNPDDLYNIREEQELLIETRFKELLKKMVGDGLSLPEDKEFDFIVTHFYQIYLPAIESVDEKTYKNLGLGECACVDDIDYCANDCLPGGLSDIKFEIYRQSATMHKFTIDKKFWEANKKFVFNNRQNIWDDISDVIDDAEDAVRSRILKIEDYEKDILLATLQTINVTHRYGKLKKYEELYHHKYDEEQLTKRAIKLLIECGAKLNKALLGYWQVIAWEHSIIDKLVELHKNYKAPLLVPICENGRYHYFTVNNTANNRVKLGIKHENEAFDESDYQELENRLYAGEKTILKPYKDWICGSKEWGAFLHARKQILNMSLEAYNERRDGKMTEELLANLDSLSLAEIRKKYFPSEYRGKYIDDANSMNSEEFKKKYYIKEVPNE